MNKVLKVLIVIILVVLVVLLVAHFCRKYLYTPKVNAYPRYFMTVKGKISPALAKAAKMQWQVIYATTSNSGICRKVANLLEGVSFARTKKAQYEVKIDKNGFYQSKIPLDGFRKGYCGWSSVNLSYNISFENQTKTFGSAGVKIVTYPVRGNKIAKVMWLCKKVKDGSVYCETDLRKKKIFNNDWSAYGKSNDLEYIVNVNN